MSETPKKTGCLMQGCLICVLVMGVLFVLATMIVGVGGRVSQRRVEVLPGISLFLEKHREFGTPSSVQDIPNWAKGTRQRVGFRGGRSLLFYLEGGRVVTIYEDVAGAGRQKIWGEYASEETSEPARAPEPRRPVLTPTSPFLMDEVVAFLESHPQFGVATGSRPPSKSMMGTRQSVEFDSGKTLIFFQQEGTVTRVCEEGPDGLKQVWGKFATDRP